MAAALRRLACLAAVHVRNLDVAADAPDASTSAPSPALACLVTLRRPNEVPFYVSPPAHGAHASWGEYTSAPLCPSRDFAPWAWSQTSELLVGLYASTHERWICVWEVEVDLRTLSSVGSELSSLRDTRANVVYLGLRSSETDAHLEYIAIHDQETQELDADEAGRRAMLLSMVETQMKHSYTFGQACQIIRAQGELAALQHTHDALQERCGGALTNSALSVKVCVCPHAAPAARGSAHRQGPTPLGPVSQRRAG